MKHLVFLFWVLLVAFVRSEANISFAESLKEVQTTVTEFISPEDREEELNLVTDYFQGLNFEEFYQDLQHGRYDNRSCHICNQAIIYGKSILKNAEVFKVWAKSFCHKQKFQPEVVCYGNALRMAEPVVYILQNSKLTSAEMCSVLLHPNCTTYLNQPISKNVIWELPLPPKKEFKPVNENLRALKMLHLSDFHLDLSYTTGSPSNCKYRPCCHSTSIPKPDGANRSAGFWSETDNFCDTPSIFIETALKQIADKHKDIDFVIWTGDNTAHDNWNITRESNLKHIKTASDFMKTSFKNIPVFPSLGNHDTHPTNFYVPSDVPKETNLTMDWLYDTLSDDYWSQWINTESAKKTFKRGGYFSGLVNKGLKVIVLNDGISDKRSFWIAHTSIDPDEQLKWLIQELDESETNGRYAIIIGHYPPLKCYLAWANNYFKIMERYRDVIAGTYFGHTHHDEFVVLHNKNMTSNETYPVSLGLIAPSITTWPNLNPGYRVFSLDKFGKPVDFSMFYTDIVSDNKEGPYVEPEWKLAFSAKEDYGLTDMSPESWDQFITRAQTDEKLSEKFFNNYHRFSETFVKMEDLSLQEKKQLILSRRFVNPIHTLLEKITDK